MFEKSNDTDLSAKASATAEEVTFDNSGHIERFPIIRKLFLALVIILVAALSFGIGRLTGVGNREGIRIEYDPEISNSQTANVLSAVSSTQVVASSKGKKYHYAHCPGAKQISEANKITFTSAEAAEASGYTLAAKCLPK